MSDCLADIFARDGSPTTTSGNDPLPLIDPGAVWLVTRGRVDIVAMTIGRSGDLSDVNRTHLLRIEEGQLLFGFRAPPAGHSVLLLGYGAGDAEVTRLSVEQLAGAAHDAAIGAETARLVDTWVNEICELCAEGQAPLGAQNIRGGTLCCLADGNSAQPMGGVLWLYPQAGAARFMGHDGIGRVEGEILFPAGHEAWLTAEGQCELAPHDGAEVVTCEEYWRGLSEFQTTVETVIDVQRTHERDAARQRLVQKREATRSGLASALGHLEAILHRRRRTLRPGGPNEGDLLATCRLVAGPIAIDVVDPGSADGRKRVNPLDAIAKASRFSLRRVRLEAGWHRRDNGPLLGFRRGGDTPVALLPAGPKRYEAHCIADGTVRRVDDARAGELEPAAFMFYRSLPDRPVGALDLLRFAVNGVRRDVLTVVAIGALGGMLTLVTPMAIGHVFDSLIPGAERGRLLHVMIGLVVAAFAATAFQLTRNIALIRLQHRAGNLLQAAIWDRVVNLPAKFFRDYTAGDLGVRAMGIERIMEVLSTNVITTIVSGIFSAFSVVLLFYYAPGAAVVALGLVFVVVIVTIACGAAQLRYESALEESHGRMAGMLLQFINGIAKIRIAAAEDRAFAVWAVKYAEQTRFALHSRIITNNLDVFSATFPVLTYMTIFMIMAPGSDDGGDAITTGGFLAFISAFATFFYGMMRLGSTVVDTINLLPVYDRLTPVLKAEPEVDETKTDPGALRGRIEVSNVSFRYEPNGPPILEDVSLVAAPGEFIAVVGPSGSGKSTLLRIMLGFEKPEAGTITFDGHDLASVDPRALRRQLGVVLQGGSLMPGDVFTNIVGSAVDLTLNDAWEAARLAGLERDIEEMPMGMHTVISEGAGTLSGGQRQRLMIARALVTKPRIVFFDEATSALDNPTQAIVTASLDRMRATRVVIAHRLSTIINADRIFVVDRGRVAQWGTYDELVERPGLFMELVKRQMA
ncbi:MAG: NHLP bacteriocin export ABC transporter permease/ATPase subunit [Planctomycetes bacterium]|nr:NHLP bacteriocin export ABC transporter permease/ATPase subunit [Planctomycetota bacterium]